MSTATTAAHRVRLLDVRATALSADEVLAAVADPAAGGTTLFLGMVRNHDHDRVREVAERVAADPLVIALAAVHRTGDLVVGDIAVIVAVAAAHRDAAFAASRRLIDELKADVPIWKHQRFSDGTTEWVGVC